MLVRSAWTGPPAKTSGTEIRRTPDVKLRFGGFRRFAGFNFGQVQLLTFVLVMVRSNSFGRVNNPPFVVTENIYIPKRLLLDYFLSHYYCFIK